MEIRAFTYNYFFLMCTLKDNLPVKKVVLDDKHPK